ncbi:MAG: hypothetical protein D6675_02130 [Gemmatimonadetes bacterium]|nr:MAG: hypothetical protein D6675_02130 [Gemmatimonadota bacterium]
MKTFGIKSIPQVILVDVSSKEEIDRIMGFSTKDAYLKTLNDYLNGIGTLAYLKEKLKADPQSAELKFQIGQKYFYRGDQEAALPYLKTVIQTTPFHTAEHQTSAYYIGTIELETSGKTARLEQLAKTANDDIAQQSYTALARYYARQEEPEKEAAVLEAMADRFNDDPQALNSFAWRMTELEMKLEKALAYAQKAAELSEVGSEDQAMILDTVAEVHYKLGDKASAIAVINKAIHIKPDDDYYKKQLAKFEQMDEEK